MNTKEILQGIKDWAAPKVIYDISAAHNNTKYTDLSDALGTNGVNIPQEYKKGGITIRYVQSSDNKYVQFRLKTQNFSTVVSDWEEDDFSKIKDNVGIVEIYSAKAWINGASPNVWAVASTQEYGFIAVNPNDVVTIPSYCALKRYAFVKSKDVIIGSVPDYSSSYDRVYTFDLNKITVPSDAHYIALPIKHEGSVCLPEHIIINGIDYLTTNVRGRIDSIHKENELINDKVFAEEKVVDIATIATPQRMYNIFDAAKLGLIDGDIIEVDFIVEGDISYYLYPLGKTTGATFYQESTSRIFTVNSAESQFYMVNITSIATEATLTVKYKRVSLFGNINSLNNITGNYRLFRGAANSDGQISSSTIRLTPGVIKLDSDITVHCNDGYKVDGFAGNAQNNLSTDLTWFLVDEGIYTIHASDYAYVMLQIAKKDNSTINIEDEHGFSITGAYSLAVYNYNNIKHNFQKIEEYSKKTQLIEGYDTLVQGAGSTNGTIASSSIRLCSGVIELFDDLKVHCNQGYRVSAFVGDSPNNLPTDKSWFLKGGSTIFKKEHQYAIFTVARIDNSDISLSDDTGFYIISNTVLLQKGGGGNSEVVMNILNSYASEVENIGSQSDDNSSNIASINQTLESISRIDEDIDIDTEAIKQYIESHSIAQDKDDIIAWYYNNGFRDVKNTFRNYINTLYTTKNISKDVLSLYQEGDRLTHDATICVNEALNEAYVVCTANATNSGGDAPAEGVLTTTRMYIIDLSGSTLSIKDVFEVFEAGKTYGNITINSTTGTGTPNAYIVGNVLHIISNIRIDGGDDTFTLAHASFNTTNKEFTSYDVCKVTLNNVEQDMSCKNLQAFLNNSGDTSVVITQTTSTAQNGYLNPNSTIGYDSATGYYYMTVGRLAYWKRPPIFRSLDFINWEFCTLPQVYHVRGNFEGALAVYNGFLYDAIRQDVEWDTTTTPVTVANNGRSTLVVCKMSLSDYRVIEECVMPDDSSRPCFFFNKSGELYLLHSVYGRTIGDVVKIDRYMLKHSFVKQQISRLMQYPSFALLSNGKYIACSTEGGIVRSYKVQLQGVADLVVDSVFESLFEIE